MTIKQLLSGNNGGLLGAKPAFDRFHHSSPSGHGYYGGHGGYSVPGPSYPPPQPAGHIFKHYSFSHSQGGGNSKGGSAALSALTLLSFLFFLNILQQCLKDQMMSMTPQVMVMASSKEDQVTRGKQAKITPVTEDTTYTLIDGVGRAYPEQLILTEHTDPETVQPVFVDAMGEGIGEIINEQR